MNAGRCHEVNNWTPKLSSAWPHMVLTPDAECGRGPLLPAHTQILPSILHGQVTDLQLTHGSLLPQAHSGPGSEGLGPLPPLHGGRLAQLTAQLGCGPFHGLFLHETLHELGRQGWRWSERHKHITCPELTEATGYREYTETQNPTGPGPPAGVPAHNATVTLKGPAVHVPRDRQRSRQRQRKYLRKEKEQTSQLAGWERELRAERQRAAAKRQPMWPHAVFTPDGERG